MENQSSRWIYWHLGLLCSLLAVMTSAASDIDLDQGAFALITFLFLWGLIQPVTRRT